MTRPRANHSVRPIRTRAARGGAYVAVLGLGMLAVVVGTGALAAARVRYRIGSLGADASVARSAARSAVEHARAMIAHTSSWRTTYTNGNWVTNQSLGQGSYTLQVQNPNGLLNRNELDPVVVTATGSAGQATQTLRMRLNAYRNPLTCLEIPLTVSSLASFVTTTVSTSGGDNRTIASNVSVKSVLSTIDADVECTGLVLGTGFLGAVRSVTTARTLPASTAFDYYKSNGTAIDVTSLYRPPLSTARTMSDVLLSPASNPYGKTDPAGIYVLDCKSVTVTISNCRVVGTLVLLNPGAGSAVQGSVNFAPAIANYPCLMVQGAMSIGTSSTSLSEASRSVNFNPSDTPYPYPSGNANSTMTDSYASAFSGLVYVSGALSTSSSPRFDLLVVGGTLTTSGSLTLSYSGRYNTSPPPGFYTVSMVPEPGSWEQVTQ